MKGHDLRSRDDYYEPPLDGETRRLREYHEMLVGCELDFALDMCRDLLKAGQLTIRVMRKDGKNCIGTTGFDRNRVNVAVVNNVITSIISIG